MVLTLLSFANSFTTSITTRGHRPRLLQRKKNGH
jgi:hypothetical protein